MTTRSDADGPQPSPTKLQSATRWESWYTRKYCYYVVKRSIIIMGQLLIHTEGAPYCRRIQTREAEPSSEETRLDTRLYSKRTTQPRTGGGGRVRGSVAGSRGGRGRVGFSRFHGRLATRARRSPAVHPRGTLRALGEALAPSAGPLCAAHLAYSQPIHTGPCACARRARTRRTTAFTRHTTRGRRVPPTPDHRPSRPRPDASITVGSEGVRLMARARPL
jgi:hypothetical protein